MGCEVKFRAYRLRTLRNMNNNSNNKSNNNLLGNSLLLTQEEEQRNRLRMRCKKWTLAAKTTMRRQMNSQATVEVMLIYFRITQLPKVSKVMRKAASTWVAAKPQPHPSRPNPSSRGKEKRT